MRGLNCTNHIENYLCNLRILRPMIFFGYKKKKSTETFWESHYTLVDFKKSKWCSTNVIKQSSLLTLEKTVFFTVQKRFTTSSCQIEEKNLEPFRTLTHKTCPLRWLTRTQKYYTLMTTHIFWFQFIDTSH